MKNLSLLAWSPTKRLVSTPITLCPFQAAAQATSRTEVVVNGPGTAQKALRRAKTRLVVALTISVTAALTPVPQAAAADGPYFYIVNSGTRMMAEVFAHHTDNGARVVLWPHYGGTSQQFTVQRLPLRNSYQPPEEQWFLLRARHSDKCPKTDGYQSGAPVVQAVCGGEAAQMEGANSDHDGGGVPLRSVLRGLPSRPGKLLRSRATMPGCGER